jgi:parallel beta-helix repeat protein
VDNYIHDNGRFDDASHANLDHGIYIGEGSGVIEGNRIEHNYAYGVQLYPKAHDVTVRNNVITRHGRAGVIIAEDAANNQVVDNTVNGNRRGIQAWSLRGKGNVVRSNKLWDNHEGNLLDLDGVSVSGNDSR